MATATAPASSVTRFAATCVRERRKRSGTSGAGWRDSITAKAARSAAAPATRRIV